jgi:hypothetical protein
MKTAGPAPLISEAKRWLLPRLADALKRQMRQEPGADRFPFAEA